MLIFVTTYKLTGLTLLPRCTSVAWKSISFSIMSLLVVGVLSVTNNNPNDSFGQHFANNSSSGLTAGSNTANDPPSPLQIKALVASAILEIKNNDIGKALASLNLVDRQLGTLGNSSPVQSLKVIMKDTIGLLQVGSTAKALLRLSQSENQFAALGIGAKKTTATKTTPAPQPPRAKTTAKSTTGATSSKVIRPRITAPPAPTASVGANTPGALPQVSSNPQCVVVPGPAMTFRVVCPNGNNGTSTNNSVTAPQQPRSSITPPQPAPSQPALTHKPVSPETPPLAMAGPSQTAATGIIVTLNGSGSYDPDGDKIVSYRWSESRSDPQVALSNYTSSNPSFASPIVKTPTNLTFFLTVNDGRHDSIPASSTVIVLPKQLSPTFSLNLPANQSNNTLPPSLTALPQSQRTLTPGNQPFIPPTRTNPSPIPNNNAGILSLLQNPGLNSSSLPGISSPINGNTSKTYNNPLYGINIQYPSSWKVEEGDNFLFGSHVSNVATFIPPGGASGPRSYHTYVAISIESNNSSSLADYLKYTLNQYAGLPAFNMTESNTNAILAGNPAYLLGYSYLSSGLPTKVIEVGTLIGDKAYFISYATDPQTYSSYLPAVYTMIKSLGLNVKNTLNPPQNTLNPPQNTLNPPQNNVPAGGAGASGSIPK